MVVGQRRWLGVHMGLAFGKVFEEGEILFLNILGLLLKMALEFILGLTFGVRTVLSKSSFHNLFRLIMEDVSITMYLTDN